MSKFDSALAELLYHQSLISWQDETMGSTDELGWYGLFRGPLTVEEIDEHNADEMRQRRMGKAGSEQAMSAAGFILDEDNQGFVGVAVYPTTEGLERAWLLIWRRYERYYGTEGEE